MSRSRQLISQMLVLAVVGLLAVGLSAVVALAIGVGATDSFVAGNADDVLAPDGRCAGLRVDTAAARHCEAAADAHHVREMLAVRSTAGALGIIGLLGLVVASRRRPDRFSADRLPPGFTDAVATLVFGIAAVSQLALVVDAQAHGGRGVGLWLSGGIVAAAVATVAALRWTRSRTPRGPAA